MTERHLLIREFGDIIDGGFQGRITRTADERLLADHQFAVPLEIRFGPALIAICTQGVAHSARCHRALQEVSHRARTDLGKLIPLLLCRPVFQASNFFFQIVDTLRTRQLRRVCTDEFFQKFYARPLSNLGVVHPLQTLRDLEQRIEAAQSVLKFREHELLASLERRHAVSVGAATDDGRGASLAQEPGSE